MRLGANAKGGDDLYNDCLYNCILEAFGNDKELLPRDIRKPHKLKLRLGLERDDKVDVSKLEIIEDLYNWSFTVSGDVTYVSKTPKPLNVNLNLYNEHFTLRCNENRSRTDNTTFKEVKPENVLSMHKNGNKISVYNGDETIEMKASDERIKEYRSSHDYIYLYCDVYEDLEETRDNYIKNAKIL